MASKEEKFVYGLIKSGEEGAELAQAVLKFLNHAEEFEMEDGNEFFEKLVEEFGDVLAATWFTQRNCSTHFLARVTDRALFKLNRYENRDNNDGRPN